MLLQKHLYRHKNQFYWMKIICLSGTKMILTATICKWVFGLAQKFGPAQNILGPVKGQGIKKSLENPWYLRTTNRWIGWWDMIIETQMKSSESQFCHSPTTKDLRLHQHHISSPFRAEKEKKERKIKQWRASEERRRKNKFLVFPIIKFFDSRIQI